VKMVEITQRLIGLKYELGKVDCFRLIITYMELIGKKLPSEYKGYTLETYKDLYLRNSKEAKELMVELMNDLLEPINIHHILPGDICLLKLRSSKPFLGIETGNANLIVAAETKGVTVVPRKYYTILGAWRCRQQYQP
jgi:hypothetical protein